MRRVEVKVQMLSFLFGYREDIKGPLNPFSFYLGNGAWEGTIVNKVLNKVFLNVFRTGLIIELEKLSIHGSLVKPICMQVIKKYTVLLAACHCEVRNGGVPKATIS